MNYYSRYILAWKLLARMTAANVMETLDIARALEQEIERFVEYYNYHRYHESLDNLTPADVYFGRKRECLYLREMIKRETLKARRVYNLGKR